MNTKILLLLAFVLFFASTLGQEESTDSPVDMMSTDSVETSSVMDISTSSGSASDSDSDSDSDEDSDSDSDDSAISSTLSGSDSDSDSDSDDSSMATSESGSGSDSDDDDSESDDDDDDDDESDDDQSDDDNEEDDDSEESSVDEEGSQEEDDDDDSDDDDSSDDGAVQDVALEDDADLATSAAESGSVVFVSVLVCVAFVTLAGLAGAYFVYRKVPSARRKRYDGVGSIDLDPEETHHVIEEADICENTVQDSPVGVDAEMVPMTV